MFNHFINVLHFLQSHCVVGSQSWTARGLFSTLISNTSRGPSCFSNSSWGNRLRHLDHEAHACDTPLSAGWQPSQVCADWLVRNSTNFSLAVWGTIWQHMQIVSMWQLKSQSAEQPRTERQKESKREVEEKGEWRRHALLEKVAL